ncbi:UNKNOWN [Stylonychia lemnae]|uniref:Uncharacterized protein n=1 Tax=Stylonychia lemnae TaxID=5949 RepID=A0A078A9M3_STYLE|nr:UNKNOWN [Stylonychia lemnae]|eukprot:CDW78576.1 UNKNOWN [Stylonychia lemnae]
MNSNLQTNNSQGPNHYISDRIEKTIQKFSKQQIIKTNSPFMNQNGKSRNFNQSNSASKIYSSTLKGLNTKNFQSSPYVNNGIYQTQLQNEDSSLQVQQFDDNLKHIRKYEMSADKKLQELSFESLNPINNSFTDGQEGQINNNRILAVRSNQKINNPQQVIMKQQFQRMNGIGINPTGSISLFQQADHNISQNYLPIKSNLNQNFDDSSSNGSAIRSQNNITNPHIQWWQAQMQSQQPPSSQFQANYEPSNNLKFQIPQIQQVYPQSAHISPFQQSKSREGGYRNIPMRDLSSISDQSPQKPVDVIDPENPFKGPKLHLFKKGNSRRIKTSSATRNLQPIYHYENQKLAANFLSINPGLNTGQMQLDANSYYQIINKQQINENDQDQHNSKYQTIDQDKRQFQQYQQHPLSKLGNPIIHGSQEAYSNDQQVYNQMKERPYMNNISAFNRPNTTSLDKLMSEASPKRPLFNIGPNGNPLEPSNGLQGLSKAQLLEEINGFKHSFYNDKTTPKVQSNKSSNIDSARQIEKMKEQIHNNSETIKHIFVINNNNINTNVQSTQESKAMTPCFLHTPNMTNKWENFNPNDQQISINEENRSSEKIKQQKVLQKQDKTIKVVLSNKKPQTSHQSKNQSIIGQVELKKKNNNEIVESITNSAKKQDVDGINLGPEDIYLLNPSSVNLTQKVSRNNQVSKPQTSNSFRRPVSRNIAVVNSNSQNPQPQKKQVITTEKIVLRRPSNQQPQYQKVQFQSYTKTSDSNYQNKNGLIKEQQAEEESDQ